MRKIATLAFCLALVPGSALAQLVLPGGGGAGGGGTPGGASTNVQFNSGGASFGGDSGLTYAGTGGKLQLTPAANTAQPFLITGGSTTGSGTGKLGESVVGTLNTTGIVDGAAFFANITNTASLAGSTLFDFQIGGSSAFSLSTTGVNLIYGLGGTNAVFSIYGAGANVSIGNYSIQMQDTGVPSVVISNGGTLKLTTGIGGGGGQVVLTADAAAALAMVNATAAQTIRVYNTSTSGTSYERGTFDWNNVANVLSIGTEKGSGGGSVRNMEFIIGGTNELDFGVTAAGIWTSATAFGAPTFKSSGSVPVDGGGSCLASSFAGGATAGTFAAASCAGGTIAITFAFTAPTGWSCDAEDRTTPSTGKLQQNATTATKATFLATNSAADVIQYKCIAY